MYPGQSEREAGYCEGGGEREQEHEQSQPGVSAEPAEEGQHPAQVTPGELEKQLVPAIFRIIWGTRLNDLGSESSI